ncbi:MAG: hypothetical protein IMF11_20905, partial [Proteobacteria bacterium]|nr:hypothetical protein [Pseudomonadota bacterium]
MKRNLIILSCLLVFFAFTGSQAMAVQVWGEGAYTDTDVQVCIYANTESDALRSFGVRLIYDSSELTYVSSTKNEADWYLTDGNGTQYNYQEPEDVVVGGSDRAVVIIGGVLDPDKVPDEVSGSRVLLGTVWFTRTGSGPLANALTLDLGKVSPYANFVRGPEETDVLDGLVSFLSVDVYERGDADGSGEITNVDMGTVRNMILDGGYVCYADANADGDITNVDMGEIRNIILG